MPAFAAAQAWSDPDYRARTIAAVLVALLQKFGATVPILFLGIGGATLLVAVAIWKTMLMAN